MYCQPQVIEVARQVDAPALPLHVGDVTAISAGPVLDSVLLAL